MTALTPTQRALCRHAIVKIINGHHACHRCGEPMQRVPCEDCDTTGKQLDRRTFLAVDCEGCGGDGYTYQESES